MIHSKERRKIIVLNFRTVTMDSDQTARLSDKGQRCFLFYLLEYRDIIIIKKDRIRLRLFSFFPLFFLFLFIQLPIKTISSFKQERWPVKAGLRWSRDRKSDGCNMFTHQRTAARFDKVNWFWTCERSTPAVLPLSNVFRHDYSRCERHVFDWEYALIIRIISLIVVIKLVADCKD